MAFSNLYVDTLVLDEQEWILQGENPGMLDQQTSG